MPYFLPVYSKVLFCFLGITFGIIMHQGYMLSYLITFQPLRSEKFPKCYRRDTGTKNTHLCKIISFLVSFRILNMHKFVCFYARFFRNPISFEKTSKITIILYFKNRVIICIYFGRIRFLIKKLLLDEPGQKVYKFTHIFKIKIGPRGAC